MPDIWSRLGKTIGHLLGVLLRVLFVVIVAVSLTAAVYFGAPWVYRQVIHPVQSGLAQRALLQRQVDETNSQWVENFGAHQQRIADLESQLGGQGEQIASLEAGLSRVDEKLVAQQAALDELTSAVAGIASDYASLGDVETLRDDIATLEEDVTFSEQVVTQLNVLECRIALVQAWQEVLKTHLYIAGGNIGDAETMLALATTHLGQAAALHVESDREAITTIQAHLAQAASRLREQPVIAAQNLESAWYELGALISLE